MALSGCSSSGGGGTQPDTNKPPTVTFTLNKIAVPTGADVTLTAAADDPDGDPVIVTWAMTRGTPTAGQGPSILWTAPAIAGTDTITITATDDKGGSTTTEAYLREGTLKTDDIVTSGVVWGIVDSPYIVRPTGPNFTIATGASLQIDAGVEVFVDRPDASIWVEGALNVMGQVGQAVTFTANQSTPQLGFWAGFTGANGPSPTINLQDAIISHAAHGIDARASTSTFLTRCKITFCSDSAVHNEAIGVLSIVDCIITNNAKEAIRIEQSVVSLPDSIAIMGDSIAVNGDLSGQTAYTNGEAAITIDLDDKSGSVPILITGNEISRNGFPGIRLLTAVYPTITDNAIFGNEFGKGGTKTEIRLEPPFDTGFIPVINGKNNYWGQVYTDSTLIKAKIYDYGDNPGSVDTRVLVTPWRNVWP